MMILKIFLLVIWLLAVPFCMGLLFMPLLKERLRTPGVVLTAGYIFFFTLLELIGIPVVLLAVYHGFTTFKLIFTPVILVCAAAGVFITLYGKKKKPSWGFSKMGKWESISLEEKIVFLLFLVIVGFQLYMAFTRASFDGDDAYYGVHAVAAQQIDTLYRVNPYTGRSAPLDVRHALALFPIWEAYVGEMSGVHATIVTHTAVPLILIPLTYILYYQIGKILLRNRKDMLPMFMVVIALWQMFGNISIYTVETFFLTRTWQGKSFAGNFVIPAVIWIFLSLFVSKDEQKEGEFVRMASLEKSRESGPWILLACLNFAGGASSSLAILLSCLLSAGLAVLFAIRERSFGILVKVSLCCVPGGLYVLLYLLLTHGIIVL